jgi:RNA polymerase sigma-70 factor, ECF subfamily
MLPAGRLAFLGACVETPEVGPLGRSQRIESPQDEVMRLFAAHGPALYRFCLFVVRHQQDAEDVVQDTFVKLLEHVEASGSRTNPRSWLFTVAANGCRDRCRRRRRWLPWLEDADTRTASHDAETAPERAERQRALLESARHLRPRDRILLMLRVQGLSYREIAAAEDIPEASVGRLLARARERWKRAYRRCAGDLP